MNETIRFDLRDLVPRTEIVPVSALRPGDLVWLGYCSTPTFGLVARVETDPATGGLSVLDALGSGTDYTAEQAGTTTAERLVVPIELEPRHLVWAATVRCSVGDPSSRAAALDAVCGRILAASPGTRLRRLEAIGMILAWTSDPRVVVSLRGDPDVEELDAGDDRFLELHGSPAGDP